VHYDAFVFIESIRNRFWLGMLAAIDTALLSAARWPTARKRPGPFHPGSDTEFMRFLMATRRYLLSEGRLRPEGLEQDQFDLLKPLCEHLVQTGRFAPDTIKLFDQPGPWNAQAAPNSEAAPRKDRA
jgi:hypothetical protein